MGKKKTGGIGEKKTYQDVIKAREVWFEELLEIFLPKVLEKLSKEGKISISPSAIKLR